MTKIRLGREVSVATVLVMAMCASAGAQSLPPISIGGGLQTSFVHTEPEDDDGTDAFVLNSIRLYLSGSATDNIKINKTDLAPLIGADLDVMARDSKKMRGSGPLLFAQVTNGIGVREIADELLGSWRAATRLQPAERE